MLYEAKVLDINPNEYEGCVFLEVRGERIKCSYMAPCDFAVTYLKRSDKVVVDLWLSYAEDNLEVVRSTTMFFDNKTMIAGGEIQGRIETILASRSLRINCGNLMFDVAVRKTSPFKEAEYVKASGTYQVFFPNTEYSYEEIG